jgi:hypothetical protein
MGLRKCAQTILLTIFRSDSSAGLVNKFSSVAVAYSKREA